MAKRMAAKRTSGATTAASRRARSTQPLDSSDGDPRAVVRALKRELTRLRDADAKLTAAEASRDELRRERDQQKKRTDQAQVSVATLTETLEAIKAITHGKRVDRRLARAQKLAERGLRRSQPKTRPAGRRS
jgi:chromosome segregation ATPase